MQILVGPTKRDQPSLVKDSHYAYLARSAHAFLSVKLAALILLGLPLASLLLRAAAHVQAAAHAHAAAHALAAAHAQAAANALAAANAQAAPMRQHRYAPGVAAMAAAVTALAAAKMVAAAAAAATAAATAGAVAAGRCDRLFTVGYAVFTAHGASIYICTYIYISARLSIYVPTYIYICVSVLG